MGHIYNNHETNAPNKKELHIQPLQTKPLHQQQKIMKPCFDFVWSGSGCYSAFSTSTIASFFIGIRQFLLLPNSTITTSSVMSMTTP